MISFACGAVVFYLLDRLKRRGGDRLWLIAPLMALWANLHAGFFIGVLLLAGFTAGEVLGRLVSPDDPAQLPWSKIGKLVLVSVVGYAALALNPYGVAMWTYAFKTFHLDVLQRLIS